MSGRRAAGTPARWAWSALIAGAIVAGAPSAPAAGDVAVADRANGRPAAVREYWTERRMRHAEPAVISLGSGKRAKSSARASDVSAASAGFPERVHGKVFFTVNGGSQPGDYVCSGTVVHSNSHTAVLTAGHCVDDPEFGGDFAVNWTFVPGYRSGSQPYGEWPAAQLLTTGPWQSGADVRQDLGIALVARDAEGRGIEDAVGARPIEFGLGRQQAFAAFGYPALPTLFEPTFDGQRLYRCDSGVTGSDSPPGAGPDPLEIECDMSGGASGGGWVNAEGALNGLTSYGYAGDFSHLYGPYFGSEARAFYERASGPALLCHGREVTNLGGAGVDDFTGTERADAFRLGGADDVAAGDGGDDRACGGGGSDRLRGDDGADRLLGGSGGDLLVGGPGEDTCIGGPGRDRARGCERRRRIP